MRTILASIASLLAILGATDTAHAWGRMGHQLVAEVAFQNLTLKAREQVHDLIGDEFVRVSTWADEIIRERRNTAPWHYVNLPGNRTTYNESADCPKQNCVVSRIREFSRVLSDPDLAKPLRAEALKFLIHFIGDLHQPLHAGYGSDRGGNEVWVRIGGKTDRLHGWWDTDLLERYWRREGDAVRDLTADLTADKKAQWAKETSPEAWANESHRIVREFVYPSGLSGTNTRETAIILPTSYQDSARTIIIARLQAAGIRLADTVNRALP